MKILFDTNIILDALLRRQPHAPAASRLIASVAQGRIDGVLCATTVTTIYYFASQLFSEDETRNRLRALFDIFAIAPVRRDILEVALGLALPDYEDAVIHESGRLAKIDCIVTRDSRGFRNAEIHIYTPYELSRILNSLEE